MNRYKLKCNLRYFVLVDVLVNFFFVLFCYLYCIMKLADMIVLYKSMADALTQFRTSIGYR